MFVTYGGGIILFSSSAGGGGGTVTGADNGLSLAGTVVELGGNPLIQVTQIDTGTFPFILENTVGLGGGELAFQNSGFAINNFYTDGVTNAELLVDANTATPEVDLIVGTPGGTASLFVTSTGGIAITDTISNIGLIGDVLFPVSGPDQYAQYGNIQSLVGSVNQRLLNTVGITNYTLYTVPAGKNQLLQINPAVIISSIGAGTVNADLIYTDEDSNAVTTHLGTYTGLTTVSLPTLTIYAQKATSVIIRITINIAGPVVNTYASCYYLGVED